jgi:RNA polymerase sigma-70 factor (ECF subfamily)
MLTGQHVAIAEGDPLPPEDRAPPIALDPVATLYREARPALLNMLRPYVVRDCAGDLVQRAFVRFIALDPDRRASIASPKAYLAKSALNLAVDDARRDARRSADQHVAYDDDDARLLPPDQIAALEARDMLNRLDATLLRLAPRTREIFLAHRVDGYSYVEIAGRTGLSVKGVEKHMSKAIAHIDRTLGER